MRTSQLFGYLRACMVVTMLLGPRPVNTEDKITLCVLLCYLMASARASDLGSGAIGTLPIYRMASRRKTTQHCLRRRKV
jgi:hypothetical protein